MSVVVVDPPEVEELRRVRKATIARRKRLVRRGGGCLLWLVGVAFVVGGAAWLVVRSLEQADQISHAKAIAQARAAGYPLKRDEIVARMPIDPRIEETTRLWRDAIAAWDADPLRPDELAKLPLALEERMDGGSDPPDRDARGRLQGEDLALALVFADRYRAAIDGAHAARESGSVANFAADIGPNETAYAHLLSLGWILAAVRIDAEARFAKGDVDGALRSLLTALAIDRALLSEPYDFAHSFRLGWFQRTFELLERTLAVESLGDQRLRTLGDAFEESAETEAFRFALAAARLSFVELAQLDDDAFVRSFGMERAARTRGSDLAKGLDCFGAIEEASERGLVAAAKQGKTISDELTTTLAADPDAPKRYPATYVLVPRAIDLATSHQRAAAQKTLARTGIACERYRLAQGDLPAKLDDLVPEYLPAVPVDPFDDQPLRYVSDETGVRLHSVGPDKTDEGGGASVGSAAAAFALSDIVFRLKKSRAVATPGSQQEAGNNGD